ncbi:MAG: ComEC/Rec2 family competence protein [Anaerolineales bacterium]|nr:ComEC/Rec2 family competence protein [Anaerolineales bacterium]
MAPVAATTAQPAPTRASLPPLALFGAGWLVGIVAGQALALATWVALLAAGLALAGLILLSRERRWQLPLACTLAAALGAARIAAAQPPLEDPGHVAGYLGPGEVTLEGVVAGEVWPGAEDVSLRVRAERLTPAGGMAPVDVRGLVLAGAPRYALDRLALAGTADYAYGDRLRLTGRLEAPPVFDGFSYRGYLAGQGVHALLRTERVVFVEAGAGNPAWQALYAFKARALALLNATFPEPHAALLAGILLGVEAGIPPALDEAFRTTGTAHIVAISGFNLAVLVGLVGALTRRLFGPGRGLWLALGAIALYTVLVGAGASVVRAAIMGSLALVGHRLGRRSFALSSLAAAAAAMTLANPYTLWDTGFQLSAMATLGLVLYGDRLQAAFERLSARLLRATPQQARRLAALAGEPLLLTLAAQITTLPLLVLHYRSLSLVSLLANVLIVPAQPAVMVAGGTALLLGLAWPPLGQVAAWLAWPFTAYTISLVQALASMPLAALPLSEVAPAPVLLGYALLFGLTWLLARPAAQRPVWWNRFAAQRLPAAGLALMAAATLTAGSWYFSLPPADGRLRITVLDLRAPDETRAGSGEAVLIQAPGGATALIGGGPGGLTLSRALDRVLPLFTRRLDLLVVAAPETSHLGGLPEALQRFAVTRVVLTHAPGQSAAYRVLRAELTERGYQVLDASQRPMLDLGDGIILRVVADSEQGSVVRLEWEAFAMLLSPGLDLAGEAALLEQHAVEPATVVLLAGGGNDGTTSDAWVEAINPQVVVISVQAGNLRGAPAPQVLARLTGRNVLRTDLNGDVRIETDGRQMWAVVER